MTSCDDIFAVFGHGKKITRNPELQLGCVELKECDFRETSKMSEIENLKSAPFYTKLF